MDNSTKYQNPSLRIEANPLSKLVLWWLKPIFTHGKKNDLKVKDLYNALPADFSEPLGNALEKNWMKEIDDAHHKKRSPKLFNAMRKTFMWSWAYYGVWNFLSSCLRVLQPYALHGLISYFAATSTVTRELAYVYASGVVIMGLCASLIDHHAMMGLTELGMRLRIASSSLVYRKILRLSPSSVNETAGGKIINLLSNDVGRFDNVFAWLHYLWITPIQTIAIAYLLWEDVQIASLAGVFFILFQTIPLQGLFSKMTSKFRSNIASRTDERVRLMYEILTGIKVIKMYIWEKPFHKLMSYTRKYEMEAIAAASYLRGFQRVTCFSFERTTLFVTVMTYVLLGNSISADKVFSMAQYFNRLQFILAVYLPIAVTSSSEAAVSIARLEQFLCLEEKQLLAIQPVAIAGQSIKIKGVTASWDKNAASNTLHDITMTIETGKFCGLIGPVGSGKSSLIQLILGELEPSQGDLMINGTVSYASQEPWLFSGSVRSNILFGQPYDEQRYKDVVRACCLLKDFAQLPQGDKTLVGEQGASLSGGQRTRINLARAVYRKADIYLFDDPLSAVNSHVARSIFEGCFKEYLNGKTRVLVTHQVQYLKAVDYVMRLNDGAIVEQGDCKVLDAVSEEDEKNPDERELSPSSEMSSFSDEKKAAHIQESEEVIAKGGLDKSLFCKYFRAGGNFWILFICVLFVVVAQLTTSGADYWVAYWTNQEESHQWQLSLSLLSLRNEITAEGNATGVANNPINSTVPDYPGVHYDRDTALGIYGALVAGSVIFLLARNFMLSKVCIAASEKLYDLMFSCLLEVPISFFHTNPSGRVLNRFSKDIGAVDELLPLPILDTIHVFTTTLAVMVQIMVINWWAVFPMIPMGFCCWKIQQLYFPTAQGLKRLETITKSPVYSHVTASLAGLATIRSMGAQEMLKKEFDSHQDVNTGANSLFISSSAAFSIWIDAVGIIFIAIISYSFIIVKDETTLAGNVGLIISQILTLFSMLQWGMRQLADMYSQMTSVERVVQFTQLDREGPFESDSDAKPPATWPNSGKITFDHVYLAYSKDSPPVLKDLNIVIESGMKVGIVGRTGAGKSTLIAALFNLAKFDGTLYIDSIDTKKIGLHDLRSKISIIPQEPMLFSATLRNNLDPLNEHTDEELWSALEEVELKSLCQSLDDVVSQGGTNFSAGQKQLLCLARAIVRRNKILILDEVTANVDASTDELIQRTIRRKFKECTVLTIAHRLLTVMDSDRILVLDHGQVVEFDAPHALLQKNDGYLTKMSYEAGASMIDQLRTIAENAFNQNVENNDQQEEHCEYYNTRL